VVRYLIAAGRIDLLRQALQEAPSNEGRVWATYGLVQAHQLPSAALGKLVHTLSGSLWTCEGCFLWESNAVDAISRL
jgi:hypothetical protein